MEREAFRQRMQQYKQARENNPQLKYWDWKKYADGGTIDEDPPQNTSERPITNFDPKDMRSIEAAYLQFATPGQYTKWFNKIPLLGTYPIVNKQFQNYEEDKDKAREQR